MQLELQAIGNCYVSAGPEPGSSAGTSSALKHWAVSPAPELSCFYGFVVWIPTILSLLNIPTHMYFLNITGIIVVIGTCWKFSIEPVSDLEILV